MYLLNRGITMCSQTQYNNVRRHNYFITQGNYIGNYIVYMFRLLISHFQASFFCQLRHKMLCTHWDPIVFTFAYVITLCNKVVVLTYII